MQAIEDWTLRDVEAMIGAPWAPPPEDKPAARALYFIWISEQIERATGEACSPQWLLAGGTPDCINELRDESYQMRRRHNDKALREMAKSEMSK